MALYTYKEVEQNFNGGMEEIHRKVQRNYVEGNREQS